MSSLNVLRWDMWKKLFNENITSLSENILRGKLMKNKDSALQIAFHSRAAGMGQDMKEPSSAKEKCEWFSFIRLRITILDESTDLRKRERGKKRLPA